MKQDKILRDVKNWCSQDKQAVGKLVLAGLSPRAAEQMAGGTYKHRLRASTLRRIDEAMNAKTR